MVIIRQATLQDVPLICQLADIIWWPVYSPILEKEQIVYMLDMMYSEQKISSQITSGEQIFLILFKDDTALGFAAYAPRTENAEVYKLHKLYCLPETKGKGYGKALLDAVEKKVKETGKHLLELNVNRYNPAKDFYAKQGFTILYTEDINIGNGYEMNDYVMQKAL